MADINEKTAPNTLAPTSEGQSSTNNVIIAQSSPNVNTEFDKEREKSAQAGNMGKEEHKEMLFWTMDEYQKFAEAVMDKPLSFYAFEVLYWCGIREGELLALTAKGGLFYGKRRRMALV